MKYGISTITEQFALQNSNFHFLQKFILKLLIFFLYLVGENTDLICSDILCFSIFDLIENKNV